MASALHRAVFAMPPLTAGLLALKGLLQPEEHSSALALWSLGPWRCLKTATWRPWPGKASRRP